MNYSQSFEEFSSGLGPTDLALYAGIGVVLFILFKDKMSPVQQFLLETFNSAKESVVDFTKPNETVVVKVPVPSTPKVTEKTIPNDPNGVFFQLVASWKKTRDLSEEYKCDEATQKLDEVFQYLSPTVCNKESVNE
jgi:hypothetical protein